VSSVPQRALELGADLGISLIAQGLVVLVLRGEGNHHYRG